MIKKTIGIFLLSIVGFAPTASFAAALNNDPQDFATLRAANKTINPPGTTTAWASSATADAGQVVSFAVYYHNTTDPAAANVRIHLSPQTTGVGTSHTFTATISADNAPLVSGTATVLLSSTQSLDFIPGSVKWYPNQTGLPAALPFGQTGTELFNSTGLNIDAVPAGWASQGSITVSFQVSGNVANNNTTTTMTTTTTTTNTTNGNTTANTSGGVTNSQSSLLPSIATQGATSITSSSAILLGMLDPHGSVDATRWFEYGTSMNFGYQTTRIEHGGTASSYAVPVAGLLPNTMYYYRAIAQNAQGVVYGATFSLITSPIFSSTINTTNNNSSYTYSTNAYYYGSAPTATTLLATEITEGSARLNGLVLSSESQSSNVWFEWGESLGLGNKTATTIVAALPSMRYDTILSGLIPGRTYYYRIVAENSYGRMYGTIMSFTTEMLITRTTDTNVANHSITKKVVYVARESGSRPAASITIQGGAEMIASNEKRMYHIVWKNTSTAMLKKVVVRVVFPAMMNVENTTMGSYSREGSAVTIDGGNLSRGASGEAFVFANMGNITPGQLVVVTANMVYTTNANTQGDVVAYVTHKGVGSTQAGGLGASLFGSGFSFPNTALGWMLLVVFVLSLVLLGTYLYGRMSEDHQ